MPNGSEDSGMVVEVTMPGYKMPEGADVSNEEGLRAWVDSVHPAFASSHLADCLIDAGYDRIASLYHISETRLIDVFEVKEGHAVQFVQAAERLRSGLGHSDAVNTPNAAGVHYKKRTTAPKIPVAAKGSQGCGVAGLGEVADIRAWLAQLVSWASSNYGAEEAKAIEPIALDPASQVYHADGVVDPEFDTVLHYALVADLPATTMQFLGVAATGTSGLKA